MHVYNLTYSTAVPINSHTDRLEYTTSRRLVIIILFKLAKLRLRLRPLELKPSKCRSDLVGRTRCPDRPGDWHPPPVGASGSAGDSKTAGCSTLKHAHTHSPQCTTPQPSHSPCSVKLNSGGNSLPSGKRVFGSRNSLKNGCAQACSGLIREDGVYSSNLATSSIASGGVLARNT